MVPINRLFQNRTFLLRAVIAIKHHQHIMTCKKCFLMDHKDSLLFDVYLNMLALLVFIFLYIKDDKVEIRPLSRDQYERQQSLFIWVKTWFYVTTMQRLGEQRGYYCPDVCLSDHILTISTPFEIHLASWNRLQINRSEKFKLSEANLV